MSILTTVTDWYTGFQKYVQETPDFEPLRAIFSLPPEKMQDFEFCHQFHFNAIGIVRGQLNEALDNMLADAFGRYVRDDQGIAQSQPPMDQSGDFNRLGYAALPSAASDVTAAMKDYLANQQVFAGTMENSDKLEPLETLRERGENLAHFNTPTVLACPHLLDMATDPEALALIEAHLRVPPTLLGVTAWWSFAEAKEDRDAQLFHFDLDDYRFCKQFIYLTDVDMEGGPHCYADGSHRTDALLRARDNWPSGAAAFMQWYLRMLRKSDADVAQAFDNRIAKLTGPAGSRFLVDTSGIHKGQRPTASDRLIIQMEYAATPMLTEFFEPVPLSNLLSANPRTATSPTDNFNYICRLLVK